MQYLECHLKQGLWPNEPISYTQEQPGNNQYHKNAEKTEEQVIQKKWCNTELINNYLDRSNERTTHSCSRCIEFLTIARSILAK